MMADAPPPAPRPEDLASFTLASFATQSVTVSDSGGSDNDLSFASFVSVASLEAHVEASATPFKEEPRPGPVTRERTGRPGPKRRYDESESSTDQAPPRKKPAKEEPKRRGKWTAPEEAYANGIIDLFVAGKFPGCSGGESLRALLSKLLLCNASVSKSINTHSVVQTPKPYNMIAIVRTTVPAVVPSHAVQDSTPKIGHKTKNNMRRLDLSASHLFFWAATLP